jgi:hypothetical protein
VLLAYAALALLLPMATTFQFRDVRERFERFYDASHARYPIELGLDGNEIRTVRPEAASQGLRAGTFLVSVNGQPFQGQTDFYAPLKGARAGGTVVLGTRASSGEGAEQRSTITLASAAAETRTTTAALLFATFNFGVPFVCLLFGFYVAAVRIRDPQAWLLLAVLLGFMRQGSGTGTAFFGYDDAFQPIGTAYAQAMESSWAIAMALFGIYFGERLPWDRRHPWVKWIFLAPFLAVVAILSVAMVVNAHDWAAAQTLIRTVAPFDGLVFLLYLGGVLVFFVGTGYKAVRGTTIDVRRRSKLLMSGLRASLRGQTIRSNGDLAGMMAVVNQLVYEGSSSNRYATFFYAKYDANDRRLTYVNAGHNPPMIIRGTGDLVRLETGGPVVGLLPVCKYEQGSVQLRPGDLFLAYTDGVTEAMTADDREWGEEGLIACARRLNGCASEGIARIMAAADEFVAGASQYDDMTLVLAYVK